MVVYISCCMLGKILENFGFWDMHQNVLGQSDCTTFRPTISLEQNHENVWFFACSWYKFLKLTWLVWLKWLGLCGKNLDKALLFLRNQAFCLKIWKIWQASATIQFNIFCWSFAHVLYLPMPIKACVGFFYFI